LFQKLDNAERSYGYTGEEGWKMKSKVITGVMLFFLVINMSTLAFDIQKAKAEPRTWTVDDDGSADFTEMQEAIHTTNSGDTIFASPVLVRTHPSGPNLHKYAGERQSKIGCIGSYNTQSFRDDFLQYLSNLAETGSIYPEPGQYANFSFLRFDYNDTISSLGFYNITYNSPVVSYFNCIYSTLQFPFSSISHKN